MREPEESLKSLVKVVKILDCFSTDQRTLSLVEVCKRMGFPKSTTHRLLASMREVGLLDQDRERDRYRLGIRLFQYGNTVLSNFDLHRESGPFVDALRRMSGQSVHLAVFDGIRAIVIHRAEPAPDSITPLSLLENAPVHCTGIGKATLAFQPEDVIERVITAGLERFTENTIVDPDTFRETLAEVKRRGYAVDDGEHQPSLRCIAAPIRDQSGKVFASISVSAPSWQLPLEKEDEMARIVMFHAVQISHRLGYDSASTTARLA